MALSGIKVPKKKPRQKVNRNTGFQDQDWTGWEKWSGDKFHRLRRRAVDTYYQLTKPADNLPHLWTWMAKNGYSKNDVRCAKAAKTPGPYVAIYARLLNLGMPAYTKAHDDYWQSLAGTGGVMRPLDDYLNQSVGLLIETGKSLVDAKEAAEAAEAAAKGGVYKPSIQEVMREAAWAMSEEIDDVVEQFIIDKDIAAVKKFKPVNILRKKQAKANHARIIRKLYEGEYEEMVKINNIPTPTQIKKLNESQQDDWDQIKEGYAHLDTKTRKAALELFKSIIDACDIIIAEAKSTRKPRKVKAKSPEALVSKLKFKVSDSEYGIASVPAAKLIGAVCAVMFNTKTRKLGIYISETSNGFGVKGTSITGFNEETSIQRTVRKPADVLPGIKKTTKNKIIKAFDALTTTETKLNGRMNIDTVIMAVYT